MDIKDIFAQESIKAYNEGYRVGCRETEGKHIETIRMLSDRISELEGKNDANKKRIAEAVEDILSRKDDPENVESRKNCVMINFIANEMHSDKPYYSILYYDKRDSTYHEGFGSYDHEIVNAYKEAYFEHWDRGYFEKQLEELEDKHWEECRQIALYDDEVRQWHSEVSKAVKEASK